MKKPNLNKLLAKWQRRLRLQDWNIDIAWGTDRDLDDINPACVGRTKINLNNFYASIRVREPNMTESWIKTLQNVELTVIHELVHVSLVWYKEQEEVCVEKLAQALLEI